MPQPSEHCEGGWYRHHLDGEGVLQGHGWGELMRIAGNAGKTVQDSGAKEVVELLLSSSVASSGQSKSTEVARYFEGYLRLDISRVLQASTSPCHLFLHMFLRMILEATSSRWL